MSIRIKVPAPGASADGPEFHVEFDDADEAIAFLNKIGIVSSRRTGSPKAPSPVVRRHKSPDAAFSGKPRFGIPGERELRVLRRLVQRGGPVPTSELIEIVGSVHNLRITSMLINKFLAKKGWSGNTDNYIEMSVRRATWTAKPQLRALIAHMMGISVHTVDQELNEIENRYSSQQAVSSGNSLLTPEQA